ncbi:hypothetical protein EV382_6025 [Micromonospora violae]|uniref:Uncharacterized protein n=1 Tax=Micromonospora violae TaxID=1278207 RepID=A0A4Q7UNV8_9ACTN|nr:hypothetical protein EV382_6025 [Micromonospora violae]
MVCNTDTRAESAHHNSMIDEGGRGAGGARSGRGRAGIGADGGRRGRGPGGRLEGAGVAELGGLG